MAYMYESVFHFPMKGAHPTGQGDIWENRYALNHVGPKVIYEKDWAVQLINKGLVSLYHIINNGKGVSIQR